MEDPNWRSEAQLQDIRSFKAAALKMADRSDRLVMTPLQSWHLLGWLGISTCVLYCPSVHQGDVHLLYCSVCCNVS